jgi:hypothetical protein
MSNDTITITLCKEEALVLFELLSRFSDTGNLNNERQADERAFWNLAALFEKELSEHF